MTALGKLFRTTVLKLSLAYLVVFAIGTGLVLGRVALNVKDLMDEQIAQTIAAQITGLSEQYYQGGIQRLVEAVQRRSNAPSASLYLVTTPAGEPIAGNVTELPPDALTTPGVVEIPYTRLGETGPHHQALARIFELPGGFRLLVGRDLEDREALRTVIGRALFESLFWLVAIGTLGGVLVALRVLKRVDSMSDAARTIMRGDLSRRLSTTGSGDEFDRLAQNLNAMIDRIAALMIGMKEVSDNIAHDLKTPLTRIRNKAEQALRTATLPEDYRGALEGLIEEADDMIRIFNALLMIARAEAGSDRGAMQAFDVAQTVRDLGELYEPAAEAEGAILTVESDSGLWIDGSRELMGQALVNLIENALKYGGADDGRKAEIALSAHHRDDAIEISVADRGPGIPLQDRARVVDRFVRLEGSRSRPGSGLGLSLAAAIVRLHEGELRLEDNGPGLRVVISLPASSRRASASAPTGPALIPAETSETS